MCKIILELNKRFYVNLRKNKHSINITSNKMYTSAYSLSFDLFRTLSEVRKAFNECKIVQLLISYSFKTHFNICLNLFQTSFDFFTCRKNSSHFCYFVVLSSLPLTLPFNFRLISSYSVLLESFIYKTFFLTFLSLYLCTQPTGNRFRLKLVFLLVLQFQVLLILQDLFPCRYLTAIIK